MSATSATRDAVVLCAAAVDADVVAVDARTGAHVRAMGVPKGFAAGGVAAVGANELAVLAPGKRAIARYGRGRTSVTSTTTTGERPSAIAGTTCGRLMASGTASGTASAWEASSGRLLARWRAHFKGVSAMTFTPCGSVLITGGEDGAVHAWRVSELTEDGGGGGGVRAWRSWTDHALAVSDVTCGRMSGCGGDVTVVSCSADRTCKIYGLGSGATLRQVRCPTALTSCALDACEATLYAGGADGRVFEIPLNGAPSMAVSLDGGLDARDGMIALEGHSKRVVGVACSTDGDFVVSASEDGTARVWDCASRQTLHILRHPKPPICDVLLVPLSAYAESSRGDAGSSRKRAKTTPAPTLSKILIGTGDRSGLKPWQGAPVALAGARESSRPRAAAAARTAAARAVPADAESEIARLKSDLAARSDDVSTARNDAEKWKKLYNDLKSIVDAQLVDN
ncbi:WD40 repeat [Ostreococcus tauri]|uniref:WD40 repeat n=2 Tax=Ostreococcus tauri TaxID=70448 RepID=A0A096P7Y7_OSTTA|nr:WD40 repeat [Ostreococcus tauri]CEG00088.1 WD40 repeat [Ostreococcus tauri]|eukprot:XP_003082599.2 WD40 repeat [Ostreococcus tauri]